MDETLNFWFIATEQFTPAQGKTWVDYATWANLPQLKELVSLDHMLCPPVLKELNKQDWEHNVREHFRTYFFRDNQYLQSRVKDYANINYLAVVFDPQREVKDELPGTGFSFYGYDLVEEGSGISSINNCGGFEGVFRNDDVSEVGLFPTYNFARSVQKALIKLYSEEIHAYCDLWAIWRMDG